MSALLKQLDAEIEALAAARGLVVEQTFGAWELAQQPQHRHRVFKYDIVQQFKLDHVQHHSLVMNFEDRNGKYNGMVLVGNLRRAIALLQSGFEIFERCDGCDTCG